MRGSGRGTPRRPDPPVPRQERPTVNYARAAAALLIPLIIAGWARQRPDDLPVRIEHVGDIDALALPLDAYRTSPAQRKLIQRAEKTLVTACLRRFGITLDLGDPAPPPFSQNARRYGLADEHGRAYSGTAPRRSPNGHRAGSAAAREEGRLGATATLTRRRGTPTGAGVSSTGAPLSPSVSATREKCWAL